MGHDSDRLIEAGLKFNPKSIVHEESDALQNISLDLATLTNHDATYWYNYYNDILFYDQLSISEVVTMARKNYLLLSYS